MQEVSTLSRQLGAGDEAWPMWLHGEGALGATLGPHFSPRTSSFHVLCAISVTNPGRQSWELLQRAWGWSWGPRQARS